MCRRSFKSHFVTSPEVVLRGENWYSVSSSLRGFTQGFLITLEIS